MNARIERWLYGMGSAVISGGASAVVASVTAAMISPDQFNPMKQTFHFFEMAVATFLMNGFLQLMFYLKQNPLPPESSGNSDPSAFIKPPE